jgi:hypothetical protein
MCRQKDNIELDVRKIGSQDVDWVQLAQGKSQWWDLMNTAINIPVP